MRTINDILESLKQIYETSSVPVVVADENLTVLWANGYAEEAYPKFKVPDGLMSMLTIFSSDHIAVLIEENKTAKKPVNIDVPVPLSLEMISLTALVEEEKLQGYVVNFRLHNAEGSALRPDGSQRLISAFSHEFRSPLTKVFSSLSALSRNLDYEESPHQKGLIEDINQNCYKMFKTSINMVDYIKYLHPNNELELVNVEICQFVRELADAIRIVSSTAGVILDCDIAEGKRIIACDVKKISAAILHLVNNSLMFGPRDNKVTLSMRFLSNSLAFTISDKGFGIPEHILPHVFEPFFSYDHFGRPFAGAGLGLTLAKSMIVLHGGTIAIRSELDRGTTVSFTIPITQNNAAQIAEPKPAADYLLDAFSNVYVMLADCCKCPTP